MSTSVRREMNRPSRSSGIVPPRFSAVKNGSRARFKLSIASARSNSAVARFRDLHYRGDESCLNRTISKRRGKTEALIHVRFVKDIY